MTDATEPDPLRLTELLAARICHDLSGPIGPMVGMLEMAREDPDAAAEALAVVTLTAASLTSRIRLARAAWAGDGGAMDTDEFAELITGALASRRVTIDLAGLAAGTLAPATTRLLLNAAMLGAECLPGGGTLTCAGQPDGDLVVSIAGPGAAWPPGLAKNASPIPARPGECCRTRAMCRCR